MKWFTNITFWSVWKDDFLKVWGHLASPFQSYGPASDFQPPWHNSLRFLQKSNLISWNELFKYFLSNHICTFLIWPLLSIFWPRWPQQTLRSVNLYERGQNQEKEGQGPIGNVKRNLLKKKKIHFFEIWGCYAMEAEIRGWTIALEWGG